MGRDLGSGAPHRRRHERATSTSRAAGLLTSGSPLAVSLPVDIDVPRRREITGWRAELDGFRTAGAAILLRRSWRHLRDDPSREDADRRHVHLPTLARAGTIGAADVSMRTV